MFHKIEGVKLINLKEYIKAIFVKENDNSEGY